MPRVILLVLVASAAVSLEAVRSKPDTTYESSSATAQQRPPDVASPKGNELVTIAGCVHGSKLKLSQETSIDLPAVLLRASEYVLEGKRELLQRLRKEHDGHYEELTEIA